MVAFAMTENQAASVVSEIFRRKPLPMPDGPEAFTALALLLGYDEPKSIERFGRKCGLSNIRVFKIPIGPPESTETAET